MIILQIGNALRFIKMGNVISTLSGWINTLATYVTVELLGMKTNMAVNVVGVATNTVGSIAAFLTVSIVYNALEKQANRLFYHLKNKNYIFYPILVENDPYYCKKIALLLSAAVHGKKTSKPFLSKLFKADRYNVYPSLDRSIIIPAESVFFKINHTRLGGDLFIMPEYSFGEISKFTISYHKTNDVLRQNVLSVIEKFDVQQLIIS